MIDFVVNNVDILFSLPSAADCDILGTEFRNILNEVFNWIQIAVPCLVMVLCSVDVVRAAIAQDENEMNKAIPRIIKRVMIGVAIFFVPMVLNILLYSAGLMSGVCKIGV